MPVIEVENLIKRYESKTAVDGVSFTVEPGEIFGILGPNGAGKTTTVECIEGLRRPDGGSVKVFGLDPLRDAEALRERLGVQLQESQLPDKMKVREALKLYASLYRDPADPLELLEQLGLTDKLDSYYSKLSGGQKQRLSIALALIGNPEVAVLDELTTGLDPSARRDTWELIEKVRDRGVTILLVTHFMDEAERLCDRLAIFNKGKVVAVDTPSALIEQVQSDVRVHFQPSKPVDSAILEALPEVTAVHTTATETVVTGTGNVLFAVTSALAAQQVIANNLRVEQANLENVFLQLTGHSIED
ncbi:ABC transporter ATP-binding protein [Dactylosporangium sp. NPDC000244]|uniref:ABC transporter ATP-binding protein n=1 Tax=Dactylosporangium sp. NPDC000244 TaxID=3154365 RepID=UPI00332D3DA0